MKNLVLLTLLAFSLDTFANANCEKMLLDAQARFATDNDLVTLVDDKVTLADSDVAAVVDEVTALTPDQEVDLFLDFTMPAGYLENRSEFEAARIRAREILLPELARIKKRWENMDQGLTFYERLKRMANQWEEAQTPAEKTAIVAHMMRKFSIPVEMNFIALVDEPNLSPEFKKAIYKAMTLIFRHDPSWQPPLEAAMKRNKLK